MGEKKEKYPKRYALTAAQGMQNPYNASRYGQNSKAGAPHKEFLAGLERYCKDVGAETIIQAIQGSYVGEIELAKYFRERSEQAGDIYMETARYKRLLLQREKENKRRDKVEAWDEKHPDSKPKDIPRHYFWDEIPENEYRRLNFRRLNQKIGVIEVQDPSQNEDPATGNRDITQDYLGISIVLPHTKQRLVSVPKDVAGKHPRLLLSTGSCTHPNYNETNRTGKKARRHHQYGFCAVDVLDEKLYLPRLVPARPDGTFIDLGIKYQNGKDPEQAKVPALIFGDMHVPYNDKEATRASFEMATHFKPKEIFIHDLLDFTSICHHNWGDTVHWMLLAEKSKEMGIEWDSLEAELNAGLNFLKELSDVAGKSQINIVSSNHDMFLYKWITTEQHLHDPKNSRLGRLIGGHYDNNNENPLKKGLEQIGEIPKNVNFLELTGDKRPWGYECGSHGHLGVSGSSGTLRSFKVSYGRGVIGHVHTIEVDGHAISVGTNSIIPLNYQKGSPSKSLHGNAVIYEGGLAQALPIIHGKWRMK